MGAQFAFWEDDLPLQHAPAKPEAPRVADLELKKSWIVQKAERFLPVALGGIVVAFMVSYLAASLSAPTLRPGSVTIALPDAPRVEPMTYKDVSRDEAKRTNDAVPLTADLIPAAKPFLVAGSVSDQSRAIDCLAATIYYEAGNEAIAGQMAVAQVVLNRVRHPSYPNSVCGVVFQGHERRTGCQFSYTCDGSMVRRRPSPAAWQSTRNLARAMLNGVVYSPVGLATHYHTDWVLPVWSNRLDKVRVERTHLFLRYHGFWGSPKAFTNRYAALEPRFAKLGILSVDHKTTETPAAVVDPLAPADLTAPPPTTEEGIAALPTNVATELNTDDRKKDVFLIYVDPLLESPALLAMANEACGKRAKCKVLAWADQGLMPRGLPLEPEDRASMAFSYIRGGGGAAKARWNCGLFPRDKKADCL